MKKKIVVLPGDGIGPEVTAVACTVLRGVAERFGHEFTFDQKLIGGIAIDKTGEPLPRETVDACREADAVLLGAVGGPKWDDPTAKVRPEQGLLAIRKELGLFANLRPVTVYTTVAAASPLKPSILEGVDILVVRELTGGIYFGPQTREETPDGIRATDTCVYTDEEIRRVVTLAFRAAQKRRKKVSSIDKANVLETSRLWRQVATEVGKKFPDVQLEHQLVDAAAMRLVTSPRDFDVIVSSNMFGDILTDEASVLAGSMGVLPSASIGAEGGGLYEPIHGSAPDIAGKGIANPVGTVLSAAMLLENGLGLPEEAKAIRTAAEKLIEAGETTPDLGGTLSTDEVGRAFLARLSAA